MARTRSGQILHERRAAEVLAADREAERRAEVERRVEAEMAAEREGAAPESVRRKWL